MTNMINTKPLILHTLSSRAAFLSLQHPNAFVVDYRRWEMFKAGERVVARGILVNSGLARAGSKLISFMLTLMLRSPGYVSHEELADRLWGEAPDGGPEDAHRNTQVYAHRARKILQPHGFDIIPGNSNLGYQCVPNSEVPARIYRVREQAAKRVRARGDAWYRARRPGRERLRPK